MKSMNELLVDIIYIRKRSLNIYIEELEKSLIGDVDKDIYIKYEIEEKLEERDFLDSLRAYLLYTDDGVKLINEMIKNNSSVDDLSKISKIDVLKQLIKEYKIEYRKNYYNSKKLGLSGVFDNNLFCAVIKRKINEYTNCNRVTRKKYVHLTAFLNELLCEMENSDNPLKILRHKMRIYSKYKNSEYIEIRNKKVQKSEVLKEILKEYNNKKGEQRNFIN